MSSSTWAPIRSLTTGRAPVWLTRRSVPGPGLVTLGHAAGGVDQDEGETRVVEEHLVDKLVFVLPAEVPEEYFAVFLRWRSGSGVELRGGLFPDSHPMGGSALLWHGGSTVNELRGEPRLADVAVAEEHDLRCGVDLGWCGWSRPRIVSTSRSQIRMYRSSSKNVASTGARRMEHQARRPLGRRRFGDSAHLRPRIRSP